MENSAANQIEKHALLEASTLLERRSLLLAMLLGLLIPGLGHIYFSERKRAILVCLALLAVALIGALLVVQFSESANLHYAYITKVSLTIIVYSAQLIDLFILHDHSRALAKPERRQIFFRGFLFFLAALFFVALPITMINDLTVKPFRVPVKSMAPTLQVGDVLLVDTYSWLTYEKPESTLVGTMVLFMLPKDESKIQVRRIVAGPGDRVRLDAGKLTINDQPIPTKKLDFDAIDLAKIVSLVPGDKPSMFSAYTETIGGKKIQTIRENNSDTEFNHYLEVTVPPGHFFVLGDHRDRSLDSRMWGFLPAVNILGVIRQIFYSGEIFGDSFNSHRFGLPVE